MISSIPNINNLQAGLIEKKYGTLIGTTTPSQNEIGNHSNEGLLHTSQCSKTGISQHDAV